jgi:predicted Zn-dependent peptidase
MTRPITDTITTETSDLPTIHETVVDGVQTFWLDVGPPFVATLMFRVGVADETLATRGITHLVEHLALSPLRDVAHPFNGAVTNEVTSFWAAGSVEDAVAFMARLADQLTNLPTDRLDIEAGVLIAEGRNFQGSSHSTILATRFGPHGPGLTAYPEFGLRRLGANDARRWAAGWFTAGNAVLLLTGPPPESMRLPLATGNRRPLTLPPDRHWFDLDGPTRVDKQTAGFAVGVFGERSTPLVMAGQAVAMRAKEVVRHELGRVYSVAHDYLRLNADEAYLYWGADSDPEHAAEVTEAFGAVLDDMIATGPTQAELNRLIAMAHQLDVMEPDNVARTELHRRAYATLCDHPRFDRAEIEAQMLAATPQDLASALNASMERAMAITVDGVDIGFAEATGRRDARIEGRMFRAKSDGTVRRYVLGDDSVCDVTGGSAITLRFDRLALVAHDDGDARLLIDERGSWIEITPTGRRLRRLVAAIDERVPPDIVVPVSRKR